MRAGTVAITVAALTLNASTCSLAAPRQGFNPPSDASRAETCFATYMTLAQAAARLDPEAESDVLEAEAGRGIRRMHSAIAAAARAIGEQAFYDRAVDSRFAERKLLRVLSINSLRRVLAHNLADDARQCDQQLDAWEVPEPPSTPSR